VVHDVSFEVTSGEVVGLLGPNGAGKTTCFYMVVGLVACDGGDVHLDDVKLTHLPIHKRARLGSFVSAAGSLGVPQADGQ
jgi:lipopolysaccharide export system ATP-binding protein